MYPYIYAHICTYRRTNQYAHTSLSRITFLTHLTTRHCRRHVWVCVCVCMCVCKNICMRVCISMHTCLHVEHKHTKLIHVHTSLWHISRRVICLCVCKCVVVSIYECVYVYQCTHIYTWNTKTQTHLSLTHLTTRHGRRHGPCLTLHRSNDITCRPVTVTQTSRGGILLYDSSQNPCRRFVRHNWREILSCTYMYICIHVSWLRLVKRRAFPPRLLWESLLFTVVILRGTIGAQSCFYVYTHIYIYVNVNI